jgi:hypothetical protein
MRRRKKRNGRKNKNNWRNHQVKNIGLKENKIILYDWDRLFVGVTVGVNPRFALRLSIKSSIRDNGRRVFVVESSGISWVLLSTNNWVFLNKENMMNKNSRKEFFWKN